MRRNRMVAGVVGVVAAAGIAGGAVAFAGGSDDEGSSVTGADADLAMAAAEAATGGGKANSVERDDEKGATWEVEVTRADGTTVDVRLDANFGVVVIDDDAEGPEGPEPAR